MKQTEHYGFRHELDIIQCDTLLNNITLSRISQTSYQIVGQKLTHFILCWTVNYYICISI